MKSHTFKITIAVSILSLFLFSCSDSEPSDNPTVEIPKGISTAQWAQAVVESSEGSFFADIAADSSGNIYTAGYIEGAGTFDFGNDVNANGTSMENTEAYINGYNAVIVKYDPSGTAQWAKSVSSGSFDTRFTGIAVDSSDNIYAVGFIKGTDTYDFGNGVTATGTSSYRMGDPIIVKYDSSGTALWAKTVSSTSSDGGSFIGVSVDSSDNIYAVGYIGSAASKYIDEKPDPSDFGENVTAAGAYMAEFGNEGGGNAVLVKYTASGKTLWARTVSTASDASYFYGVAVDSSENVYAAGSIYGINAFGFGNEVTLSGTFFSSNSVLVKYDASGTPIWAKTASEGSSTFNGVTVDSSDNVYALGEIGTKTLGFGNDVSVTNESYENNALIVKYNPSGTAQWARTTSIVDPDSNYNANSVFYGAAVDSADNLYAVGNISTGIFDFGNNAILTTGQAYYSNMVIVKYDPSGSALWAQTASSPDSPSTQSDFNGVTVDHEDNVYAAGVLDGFLDFGNDATASGTFLYWNAVVTKYQKDTVR